MPPKKATKKDKDASAATTLTVTDVRKVRRRAAADFVTAELHVRFERHVTNAQGAYLKGDNTLAEREAALALKIKPTPSIFALLSVIAESKGQFDRASDFRLLQAFLARDVLLWEELLHEFLSEQLYYKAVVCLQRMSSLEKDPARYRVMQFQLADLLVGLGEIRRATHVLVPLWNSSKCRDFEVFALLSTLYFQLGKWSSLQRLITSSLKNSFHITLFEDPKVAAANKAEEERDGEGKGGEEQQKKTAVRVSKRVRFFGDDGEDKLGEEPEGLGSPCATAGIGQEEETPSPAMGQARSSTVAAAATAADDFSFDDLEAPRQPDRDLGGDGDARAAETSAVRGLYGDTIDLVTAAQKRNFLTLVNVHAELLNESAKFGETVELVNFAASALRVALLDLPPDLLVRLGTAYAFQGGGYEQPCREVFQHLLETCRMEEYGDVLLDAAGSLQKVGMHAEAHRVFDTFERYYQFRFGIHQQTLQEARGELVTAEDALGKDAPVQQDQDVVLVEEERVRLARQRLAEVEAEHAEMRTVMAAACYGAASSLFAMHRVAEAEAEARRALEAEPTHLQVRLLLGRILFYTHHNLHAAVAVLTPTAGEPALQRIQLGATLVRVFFKSHMFIEAIALGVSIFEIILASSEDGDTESVAPGSSRRSAAPLLMPSMSRASSAIVPAASLAAIAGGNGGGTTTAGSVGRLSASLAASIRSGTSVYRQQLARRGRSALTTTVYGASAAASVAAGWGREEEEERLKDSSTIFRFSRKRATRPGTADAAKDTDMTALTDGGDAVGIKNEEEEGEHGPTESLAEAQVRRRKERREAVTSTAATGFWESPTDGDGESNGSVTSEGSGEDQQKKEVVDADTEQEADKAPRTGKKRPRRQPGKRATAAEARAAAATLPGDTDRSLDELEAFERAAREGKEGEDAASDPDVSSYELPSLEEISKRFNDPAMAQLFLEASSNEAGATATAMSAVDATGPPSALPPPQAPAGWAGANAGLGVGAGGVDPAADRATIRETVTALGRVEFMRLTVTVVDAYSMLGKFTEAKEFAFLALSRIGARRFFRRMGSAIERPLRLALLRAAMAAGHSEDAFRVGLRLLQDDQTEEERNEVVELMHGVLNRCADRTAILHRVFTDGACDVPLLVLLANRYHQTRSYTRVLNLYLAALQERPSDVFLNFMVGLSYLLSSHQKHVKPREAAVSAGVYYLSQYQSLVIAIDPSRTGEALYNAARALHFLRLHYLCTPLYQRVARDLRVPEQCSLAIQRAAQVNLYYIYAWEAENRQLAVTALPHVPRGGRGEGEK